MEEKFRHVSFNNLSVIFRDLTTLTHRLKKYFMPISHLKILKIIHIGLFSSETKSELPVCFWFLNTLFNNIKSPMCCFVFMFMAHVTNMHQIILPRAVPIWKLWLITCMREFKGSANIRNIIPLPQNHAEILMQSKPVAKWEFLQW